MAIIPPMVVTALFAGSGPKSRPAAQLRVEPFLDDARLHAHAVLFDAHQAAEMGGEVQHQPRSERFARHAAAGAAGMDGDPFFGGVAQARADVGRRPRPDHGRRPDFVDARIAGEQLQHDVVAPHLAGD